MSFEYLVFVECEVLFWGGMCCFSLGRRFEVPADLCFGRRNELARIGCDDAKSTDFRYV